MSHLTLYLLLTVKSFYTIQQSVAIHVTISCKERHRQGHRQRRTDIHNMTVDDHEDSNLIGSAYPVSYPYSFLHFGFINKVRHGIFCMIHFTGLGLMLTCSFCLAFPPVLTFLCALGLSDIPEVISQLTKQILIHKLISFLRSSQTQFQ